LTNAISTINDILYISQLKIESNVEDISNVNLVKVFEEIINDMTVLISSKEQNLIFNHQEKAEIYVQAEPKLLKLSLANLVSNSIKYTEQSGQIRIELVEEKDDVMISVSDNGIGIPAKDQDKIFTNFFRTTLSREKGIEGSGLGLSFVREVIIKYHGSISLSSPSPLQEDGKPGTIFEISLPKIYRLI
jgi:signal transduction histidine kinase